MTNFEWIKSLSETELGEALGGFLIPPCPYPFECDCHNDNCTECFINWLKGERK